MATRRGLSLLASRYTLRTSPSSAPSSLLIPSSSLSTPLFSFSTSSHFLPKAPPKEYKSKHFKTVDVELDEFVEIPKDLYDDRFNYNINVNELDSARIDQSNARTKKALLNERNGVPNSPKNQKRVEAVRRSSEVSNARRKKALLNERNGVPNSPEDQKRVEAVRRSDARKKKALLNERNGVPNSPEDQKRVEAVRRGNEVGNARRKKALLNERNGVPNSPEDQKRVEAVRRSSEVRNARTKKALLNERNGVPNSPEDQKIVEAVRRSNEVRSAKKTEKSKSAALDRAEQNGVASGLSEFSPPEVEKLIIDFSIFLFLGFDKKENLEEFIFEKSFVDGLAIVGIDVSIWMEEGKEKRAEKLVEVFTEKVVKSFRARTEEFLNQLKGRRGNGSLGDYFRLNPHAGLYFGETRRTLMEEALRWALKEGSYRGKRYLPNISFPDERKLTQEYLLGDLQFQFLVGPSFKARVYSRLCEEAFQKVSIAFLESSCPQEQVQHRRTLWKGFSYGKYEAKYDNEYNDFYPFLCVSPVVVKYLDEKIIVFNYNKVIP